jgi:GNAT superfamily N-acetyltransferase
VRQATGEDWAVLRDIRLEALSRAPDAFASSYAREAAFTEQDWRGRLSDRTVTLFGYTATAALADPADPAAVAAPAGLAGVVIEGGDADLVSMYVRPAARGTGVAAALIDVAAGWARDRGHAALFLWVTESNLAAVRLYQRVGFSPTGERQPLPSNPSLTELRMGLVLAAG